MTKWDNVVCGKELKDVRLARGRKYIIKKERAVALNELIEEGWIKYKEYKDPKFIGVRKDKHHSEVFEDKVWMMFANMGFTHMNKDRTFEMQYDYQNPNITQQIDVFAMDEDAIVIVECKSAEELKDGIFKKPIEAFHGQMEGLRKESLKKFPNRKIKFIWAINNYIMNKSDLEKLEEWNIACFSNAVIDYYYELLKHLGSCAKYQLLGNLFADQEIRNMENKIPAIQGKMGGNTYYSFSIEPDKLLKIGYVLHRNEANKNMMPTYQRLIKKKRLQEVQTFIDKGGYFPNSLIVSIDTKGRGIQFDQSSSKIDYSISKLGILHLPKRYRSVYIIDGQHRLYGYSESKYADKNSIPVVAFVDLDRKEQIKLFMDINENQKAVPKTLRVTLNSDMLWVSDDYNERRQALRSKIAQMLGEEETSPLFGRVVIGENEKTTVKCITIQALQLALKKCDFFTSYGKKNVILKDGTFDLGNNEHTADKFYIFMEDVLKYIKNNLKDEWEKGENEDGILTINRGIQGVIRIINDIVNHLIEEKAISPKIDKSEKIIEEIKYYLDPFIEFINGITNEKRKELKSIFGGGADIKYWRLFQKSISDQRNDFKPEGLEEYWINQAKIFNNESLELIRNISIEIKSVIAENLEYKYGDKWLIIGIPKGVYTRAKKEADDQNYEYQIRGGKCEITSIWDCINLEECSDIVKYGKNWSEIFESIVVPPDIIKGDKHMKTDWMVKIYNIDKQLTKPSYSVSKDEYEFIKKIYTWRIGI